MTLTAHYTVTRTLLVSLFALLVAACGSAVSENEGSPTGQGAGGSGVGNNSAGGGNVGGNSAGGNNAGGSHAGGGNINPQPGVAQNIELSIYSDGWGTLLQTQTIPTEAAVTIDVPEANPYTDPPLYYIYAKADGYYTELYSCTKGGSIDVDLDAVPEGSDAIAGVIFAVQGYFADSYFANETIQLTGPNVNTTVTTDSQGRFGLENLPAGNYSLDFTYQGEPISLDASNSTTGVDYQDLSFAEPMQAS